jgi:hypothetical protein
VSLIRSAPSIARPPSLCPFSRRWSRARRSRPPLGTDPPRHWVRWAQRWRRPRTCSGRGSPRGEGVDVVCHYGGGLALRSTDGAEYRFGGDGWESNPPGTRHRGPTDGFEGSTSATCCLRWALMAGCAEYERTRWDRGGWRASRPGWHTNGTRCLRPALASDGAGYGGKRPPRRWLSGWYAALETVYCRVPTMRVSELPVNVGEV